jgi:hypothetical protein
LLSVPSRGPFNPFLQRHSRAEPEQVARAVHRAHEASSAELGKTRAIQRRLETEQP